MKGFTVIYKTTDGQSRELKIFSLNLQNATSAANTLIKKENGKLLAIKESSTLSENGPEMLCDEVSHGSM